jgi:hypothetical protein
MLKNTSKYERDTSQGKFTISFSSFSWFATRWPQVDLPKSSSRRTRIFLSISFHQGSPCSKSPGGWRVGPFMATVQRRNLTPSTLSSSSALTYRITGCKDIYICVCVCVCVCEDNLLIFHTNLLKKVTNLLLQRGWPIIQNFSLSELVIWYLTAVLLELQL